MTVFNMQYIYKNHKNKQSETKQKSSFSLKFQNTFIKIIYVVSFEYDFSSMSC